MLSDCWVILEIIIDFSQVDYEIEQKGYFYNDTSICFDYSYLIYFRSDCEPCAFDEITVWA